MSHSFAKESCNNTIASLERFGSVPTAVNQPPHYLNTKSIAANTKVSNVRYSKPFRPPPNITNILSNTNFKVAVPTPSKTVCEDLVRVVHYFENFRRHLIFMFLIPDLLSKIKNVGSRIRIRTGGGLLRMW
jgi:hypothetical protein